MNDVSPVPLDLPVKHAIDLSKREAVCCPVCSGGDSRVQYAIRSWKIVQCKTCSFVYVNPRLEKQELLKLYVSDYFDNQLFGYYHYTEGKDFRRRNFQKWVTDALPHLTASGTLKALDIGCATGYCLDVFQEKGWQPFGVELDHGLASELRRKGFTVFDVPLLQLRNIGTFSVITLFDVIEHIPDLHENVSILHQLLDNDGIVVMVTPNYSSWQRKLFRKKWFQFKPVEHINYFTLDTLRKLLEANGFEIVQTKRSGQFCNTSFLENRLRKYHFSFALPLLRLAERLLGSKERYFYVDTASLYVVLKKKTPAKSAAKERQLS